MECKCEWCSISEKVWNRINRKAVFNWPVGLVAQRLLWQIIGEQPEIFLGNPAQQNYNLRVTLSDILIHDGGNRYALAHWIVTRWGGIRRGAESIIDWSNALAGFADEAIHAFIQNMGMNRISSWSKIIAFARPAEYAIYDSRTAIALNCALATLGDYRQFYMPYSQNRIITQARRRLSVLPQKQDRDYLAYLELLKCFVNHKHLVPDILTAEMTLFSNAPTVAPKYTQCLITDLDDKAH